MKKCAFLFLALFFASTSLPAATSNFSSKSERTEPVLLAKPSGGLVVGERLYFEVSWMGANVGYGEIEVKEKVTVNGREAYHIAAVAKTNDFLSKIYPVHDEAHSWVDAETFYSLKFRKTLSEGRYRADEETEFDTDRKKGRYLSHKDGTRKEFEIGGFVHDIVSAFYWFRGQDTPPGSSARTVVSSEEKDWELEVQALGLERKAIRDMGSVGTIRVEPKTRLKGALYNRGRVWVYFTSDSRRVPVWFHFKTPFGPVNGVLNYRKSSLRSA